MSGNAGPSPKKLKAPSTKSPQPKQSPKKFSPRKYYGQRKFVSPKKKSPGKLTSPAKRRLLPDEGTSSTAVVEGGEDARKSGTSEAYYSANFKDVLSKCLLLSNPERHVIDGEEEALVQEFLALEGSDQQLYVRLFLRKHHWIRTSKLSYEDIADDLTPILDSLHQRKFLDNESDLKDPSVVLDLLQVAELKSLCKHFHMPASVTSSAKSKMVAALFKHDREHQPLFGQSQFMSKVVAKGKEALGGCVKLSQRPVEVFSKLMLLFSITNAWLNRDEDNDFSQIIFRMLQVNIGKLVYPEYEVVTTQPLFSDRCSFDSYYQAVREEQQLQQSLENSEHNLTNMLLQKAKVALEEALQSHSPEPPLPPFYLPFTCGHVSTRVISRGVEYKEKCGQYQEANELLELLLAQDVYNLCRRGRWWDRLALNCDFHLKEKAKCLAVIERALADCHVTVATRLSLTQRARRILQSKTAASRKRKISDPDDTTALSHDPNLKNYTLSDFPEERLTPAPEVSIEGKQLHVNFKPFFLTRPKQRPPAADAATTALGEGGSAPPGHSLLGVEGYAIEHYVKKKGWPCAIHAENSTFSMLFALLMWDVIFSCVPDVFRAPFQNAPLDLFSECFYTSRREMVEARLQRIRAATEEELSSAVEQSWERHCGQVCAGVDWNLFPNAAEDAATVAACLGGRVLADLCDLFSRNYRSCCSGLPDLTLWNPVTKSCKFVEVKGPGDKLSNKQVVWLSRLMEWNCDVEVCRVKGVAINFRSHQLVLLSLELSIQTVSSDSSLMKLCVDSNYDIILLLL